MYLYYPLFERRAAIPLPTCHHLDVKDALTLRTLTRRKAENSKPGQIIWLLLVVGYSFLHLTAGKPKRKHFGLLLPLLEKISKDFEIRYIHDIPHEGEELEFVREFLGDILEKDLFLDFWMDNRFVSFTYCVGRVGDSNVPLDTMANSTTSELQQAYHIFRKLNELLTRILYMQKAKTLEKKSEILLYNDWRDLEKTAWNYSSKKVWMLDWIKMCDDM